MTKPFVLSKYDTYICTCLWNLASRIKMNSWINRFYQQWRNYYSVDLLNLQTAKHIYWVIWIFFYHFTYLWNKLLDIYLISDDTCKSSDVKLVTDSVWVLKNYHSLSLQLTNYLFRTEQLGSDLKAIDVQRSRDFGLSSYNKYRVFCGLKRANTFQDFLGEITPEVGNLIKELFCYHH